MDEPNDMYGKTMSIPDEILENYFELATDVPMGEVRALCSAATSGQTNPRDVKRRLAREIVALYHTAEAAQEADDYFLRTFSQRQQPVDATEVALPEDAFADGPIQLPVLIAALGLAKSNSDARRLMDAGAVALDGEKVTDGHAKFTADELRGKTLRVGKHQFRKVT
jgi:tyrosyl-tRNA synthetase